MSETEVSECGGERFLTLLEGPWAALIIHRLLAGPQRFSQLREALPGISPHTLTRRLRRFEAYRIVKRTIHAEVPPRVDYALTPLGKQLKPILEVMAEWARSVPEPNKAASVD